MDGCSIREDGQISIIVPVYNCEPYLTQFFESVLAQTIGNFVLYVVNDGSSDRSEEIILRYQRKLRDRLMYIRADRNGGPSRARNLGLAAFEKQPTQYLTFLDADDWFEPGYLEDLYTHSVLSGADLTVSGLTRFDAQTGKTLCTEMVTFPETPVTDVPHFKSLGYINTCLYTKLFRAEVLKGIRFRVMGRSEDTCYLFEALPRIRSILFTNHALYHYRARQFSLDRSLREQVTLSMYRQFARMLRLYETEPYRACAPLFETQVFIRCAIGEVMRNTLADPKSAFRQENRCRQYMDRYMPGWRRNIYLCFTRSCTPNLQENAVKGCALLYKLHLFRLSILPYRVLSRVLKVEVRR